MLRLFACAALLGWSTSASAFLQSAPAPTKPWPKEVQAIYDGLKQECRAEGGKFIPNRAAFATPVEVTNDGKDDWIIEYGATRCTTSGYSAWCGTAGCVISILGSSGSALKEIYNDNVREWQVVTVDKKRKGMAFAMHGSVCGAAGAEACAQTRVWDGRKWNVLSNKRGVQISRQDNAVEPNLPPRAESRWQFAGTGAGAIAAYTGHPQFAAIGIRCAPGGGLYMTAVPNKFLDLPAAGRPLTLSLKGSTEGIEATQVLTLEPGKQDFSGALAGPTHALLAGRDSSLELIVSRDGGDEWQDIDYLPLGGSTAAMRSLEKQCASAVGAKATAAASTTASVAPLGIAAGYYVGQSSACNDPIEAIFYDGKRWGYLLGGKRGEYNENHVGALGKVTKSRGSFILGAWDTEVKVLSATRIQLTIQDTGEPMRLCPTDQIPANYRVR